MCGSATRFHDDISNSNSNNDNNIDTINGLFSSPTNNGQTTTTTNAATGQQHVMAPVPIAGFNATFYNQTMPYCFAVTTGACYDSNSQTVIP